jgi:ATP phosphoribosyltransferase
MLDVESRMLDVAAKRPPAYNPPPKFMSEENRQLRVGLPSGSLQEPTISLFAKAGFIIGVSSRSYKPSVDDPELVIRLLRAQEISRYVEHGFLDCGLTGRDWIENNGSDVEQLAEFLFSKASAKPTRWVLAVPEESPIRTVKDLQGKVIATEAVEMTRRFLAKHGVTAEVEFSWGATEVKVPDLVDAIVDVTETGSSLRANNLRIVETLMESVPKFIANRAAYQDAWKKQKIDRLILLLQGAMAARDKVGLKLNLPADKLDGMLKALPSLRRPTVSQLSEPGWVAVETIIDEKVVREIIPQLKSLGAEGIIEYPLNKVVY